jgi:hypothetical protein
MFLSRFQIETCCGWGCYEFDADEKPAYEDLFDWSMSALVIMRKPEIAGRGYSQEHWAAKPASKPRDDRN